MAKKILFEWPDLRLEAIGVLADDQNPELCQSVWDSLPIESIMNHSVVAGSSVYCWTPILDFSPIHYKEALNEAPIGRIRYGQSDGNKIIIQYDEVHDDVKGAVLGMIEPEGIEAIRLVGRQAMESVFLSKKLLRVKISRLDDAPNIENQSSCGAAKIRPEIAALRDEIAAETAAIARQEPPELKGIRTGKNLGSFNQYFSTWEFVYGFLRDLSMYTMYPIAKFARQQDMSLEILCRIFKELTPPYTSYLGSWGLAKLRDYCVGFTGFLNGNEISKEEFRAVVDALYRYTNMLGSWAYFYFPWGVGACFRGPEND